ncbi:MAG: 50S ribosomal protein L2 [Planctomycetes bacterium]|nr:50S ribosomal protein L2 [Planctomycetota bacterium]
MGIKSFRPTTPSMRHTRLLDYAELAGEVAPLKSRIRGKKSSGGRNNNGRTTSAFRGGGHKKSFREVDLKRNRFDGVPAKVKSIEYDPNRSCFIAQVWYANGAKEYILAPHGLQVGQTVMSGEKAEPRLGNCLPLKSIPQGLPVHNVELYPGRGGQVARGAGAQAVVAGSDGRWVNVQMPSGEIRRFLGDCRATIGQCSNLDHMNIEYGKAGRMRWLGRRPHNRGTSMNPVDHPHGGGNDRGGGGRNPVDRHGNLNKGVRTRKPRNPADAMIVRTRRGGAPKKR